MIDWAGIGVPKVPEGTKLQKRRLIRWEFDFCTLIYCDGSLIAVVTWGFDEKGTIGTDGKYVEYKSTPKEVKLEGADSQAAKDCLKRFNDLRPKLDEELKKLK